MNILSTLIRKDWRVYRVAAVSTVLLGVVDYALFIAGAAVATIQRVDHSFARELPDAIQAGAMVGILITIIMAGVFGGMAFAEERRERSADFMTLLPPRRDHSVVSKTVVSIVFLTVCLLIHAAIALLADRFTARSIRAGDDFGETVQIFVASAAMMFGVGWGLSCFLSSSAISAGVAIAAVPALAMFLKTALEVSFDDRGRSFPIVFTVVAGLMGLVAWSIGTGHYLNRVEP